VIRKRTFCRICEPLCPLVATVDDDGQVSKLEPDREHPVSQGFACHKGLNFLQVHNDPDRINAPLRRTNARHELPAAFEPVGWEDALSEIGTRLRAIRERHGPDAISVYFGNPVSLNSNAFPLAASLGMQLGSRRNFNSGTQDTSNKPAATEAVFGTLNLFPIPDFANTHFLLCLGGNPKVSHWTYTSLHRPLSVLQDIVARGGKVRFVNPRNIESAGEKTGEVILIRPDTDVYFLAAMLCELDRSSRFDAAHIARHGSNLDGLQAFVRAYPPEAVAQVTGIDAETIIKVAHEYADAPSAATYMATGVNQGRQGTLAYWLLLMLSFVTGNLGRSGGDYYAKGFYPNARALPPQPEQWVDTPDGPLKVVAGALPAHALAPLIAEAKDPIRALIVLSGNPVLSMPGEAALRAALPQLELMVHVDLFRNATGEYADFILPAADWLERPECNLSANAMQPRPFIMAVDQVVEPRHQRRDDWWILSRLQQELGLPSALDQAEPDILGRARKIVSRLGLSLEQVRGQPGQSALLDQPQREAFYETVVFHPGNRVDCCPSAFTEAIVRFHRLFAELSAEPAGTFKLISLRTNYMHNSNLANMPALKRGKHGRNPLHIHPDDLAALGLAEDDNVRLANAYGAIETPVVADSSLRRGVVAMAHGYGHALSYGLSRARAEPGANVNALMPIGNDSHEPLSNMAHLTGVAVRIERA
jgi:anaerobic selenocysteine-containing dehydrogenase